MIELRAPGATATVSPADGGRIASLTVGGVEVLVPGTAGDHPMLWGCFPMVPWAGRVRRGHFVFAGRDYQLPINLAPHAIHGTAYDRPWDVEADGSLSIELGPRWPFGGHAVQRFTLAAGSLEVLMEVHAGGHSMPAQAGWHPWLQGPPQLTVEPARMYERDDDGIPSGRLVPPKPPPWDDCFTGLRRAPSLTWSRGPALTLTSSCDHWVIYTEPAHAVCVEPQTGPPDGLTLAPHVVEPGAPLVATMSLVWEPDEAPVDTAQGIPTDR